MKDELSSLRERLLKEYQDKRDELNRAAGRNPAPRMPAFRPIGSRSRRNSSNAAVPSKPKWRCKRWRTESESLGRFREQMRELERLRATARREAVVLAQTESARIREQTQAEDARRRLEAASELSDYEPKLRELPR